MSSTILFISYSHDSESHREKTLGLSERLREDGYETQLDQYMNGTPEEGWPRWMQAGTRKVAKKKPNAWGLYDMLGNVFEWCEDGQRDYKEPPIMDPVGPDDEGAGRVIRGGGWVGYARGARSAGRSAYGPGDRFFDLGFRCARVQQAAESAGAEQVSASRARSRDETKPRRNERSEAREILADIENCWKSHSRLGFSRETKPAP